MPSLNFGTLVVLTFLHFLFIDGEHKYVLAEDVK